MNRKIIVKQLQESLDQIPQLRGDCGDSREFKEWRASLRMILRHIDAHYLKEFDDISFTPAVYVSGSGDGPFVRACNSGLDSAEAYIKATISDIELFGEYEKEINIANREQFTSQQSIVNISMTQQQNISQSIELSKYDKETRRKINELYTELESNNRNKEKIKDIIKWLADKSVDILIAILTQQKI